MVNKNVLLDRSLDFAVNIVRLVHEVIAEREDEIMANQLFKSGTKIGARLREAEHADTIDYFIDCLERAKVKTIQTEFTLELMLRLEFIDKERYDVLNREVMILRKLIDTNIKTARQKIK